MGAGSELTVSEGITVAAPELPSEVGATHFPPSFVLLPSSSYYTARSPVPDALLSDDPRWSDYRHHRSCTFSESTKRIGVDEGVDEDGTDRPYSKLHPSRSVLVVARGAQSDIPLGRSLRTCRRTPPPSTSLVPPWERIRNVPAVDGSEEVDPWKRGCGIVRGDGTEGVCKEQCLDGSKYQE
jgi:hypothetical protein